MAQTLRESQLMPLLKQLSSKQLEEVCSKFHINKPRGKNVGLVFSEYKAPSKNQYINRIIESRVDSERILSFLQGNYALSGSRTMKTSDVERTGGKKNRVSLSLKKRMWIWNHPQAVGITKTCNICHLKITKFEDMELDHVKARSRGGVTMAMTHKDCNRMKSSGTLKEIQKQLGIH